MKRTKVKVKKLKMPLWQDLVFMAFVAIAPIVITCLELFHSHSSAFKWTFASIGALLITFIVIKKYVLNTKIEKMKEEVFALEHDYSIASGDEKLIEAKWKRYNLILYSYNAVAVLLVLVLAYLFVTALIDGLIAFKGAMTFILLFVVIGMVFKALCYTVGTYEDEEEEKEGSDVKENIR